MTDAAAIPFVIDTREQVPLEVPGDRATLPVGDYGLAGFSDWTNPRFIVERKSLDDLVQSLTHGRQRFMAECQKLRQFTFAAIIIVEAHEADIEAHRYTSAAAPASILASLDAIRVRMGLHVIFAGERVGAAVALQRLARQFVRGVEHDARLAERLKASTLAEATA